MNLRIRLLPFAGLALLLGVALFFQRPTSSAVLYTGYAQTERSVVFADVMISPPVAKPGDLLTMTTRVVNRGSGPLTPNVVVELPPNLTPNVYSLPAGATSDLQGNRIHWMPLVRPGEEVSFSTQLVAEAADVIQPEREITITLQHQGTSSHATAAIWIGIPPMIRELAGQTQVAVGQPISLKADVAGPGPMRIVWDLGDGRRLDVPEPEVVFPAPGPVQVMIEATNPAGAVNRRMTVMVLPSPVASFRPDDETPAVGQPVTFLNNGGGYPPLRVTWDFGDGSTLAGESQPTHVYERAGNYLVRLTVENSYGTSEAFWNVSVGAGPVADMIISESAAVGRPVTATAFADDSATSFMWDMGDGRREAGVSVSHSYRLPGDYYVTLRAANAFGETTVGRWIRVDPGITTLYLPLAAFQADGATANLSAAVPPGTEVVPAVEHLDEVFVLEPIQMPSGSGPAEQLYVYLNAARAAFGLPPLAYNYELSAVAQAHARDKASFPENPHSGSDGTTGAERLLRGGYRGGYAGEATAWGFADPRLAVEFWMNSDTHRPLILNRLTDEIGVGFVEDFATTNVWHWTAEFGLSYGAPVAADLRLQTPENGQLLSDDTVANFSWLWPLPLAAGERFAVYLVSGNRLVPVGTLAQPVYGSRYILSVDLRSTLRGATPSGTYDWLVRLEDSRGQTVTESARRSAVLQVAEAIPEALPTVPLILTATPAGATPVATAQPSPTPELPTPELPPVIVTATPVPSPEP